MCMCENKSMEEQRVSEEALTTRVYVLPDKGG